VTGRGSPNSSVRPTSSSPACATGRCGRSVSVRTGCALNPGLIVARLDAYGWDGPWAARRGFDGLVQMSCGIASLDDRAAPSPLPVQALDHATGYLLAGAGCRALSTLVRTSTG
jgi:crotonobetainyl-CoA:carnitine CoA-transferase CaiB-like acyl-CoA transferase